MLANGMFSGQTANEFANTIHGYIMYLLATDNSLTCMRLSLFLCDSSYNELLASLSPLYTEQTSHENRDVGKSKFDKRY